MKKNYFLLAFVLFFANGILFAQTENERIKTSTTQTTEEKKVEIKETPYDDDGTKDNVVSDDQIVIGSLGVGVDMVNNYTFGSNTIVLKADNLRILFEDESSTVGFPSNDWQIEINESANGGTNHFAIVDQTAGITPFKIMAGATSNSLFIANNGNVGLGTSNPFQEFQITDGDTPSIRLEQDESGSYSPQIWDIAGNEANFFVRDATVSTLPFRIKPAAPTNSLTIYSDGNVGVGTWSPSEKLDVRGNIRLTGFLRIPAITYDDVTYTATLGDTYLDETDSILKYYNGLEWTELANNNTLDLSGNDLSINNGNTISLEAFMDNTDEQDLVDATLTGTILEIEIENGTSVSVDLYPLIQDLEDRVAALEASSTGKVEMSYSRARLFDNTPNPFTEETLIPYFIPDGSSNAYILISDVQGIEIERIIINENGSGSITLSGAILESNAYFYTLVVDDFKVDSKVLVKL